VVRIVFLPGQDLFGPKVGAESYGQELGPKIWVDIIALFRKISIGILQTTGLSIFTERADLLIRPMVFRVNKLGLPELSARSRTSQGRYTLPLVIQTESRANKKESQGKVCQQTDVGRLHQRAANNPRIQASRRIQPIEHYT
jgi:hypothetical protein